MITKVSLFNQRRDFIFTFFLLLFLSFYSALMEYNNYKNLTRFDSQLLTATLVKQYDKTKTTKKGNKHTYKVLKLKSNSGVTFYTSTNKQNLHIGETIDFEVWLTRVSFYEYMTSFYAFSKILSIHQKSSLKERFNSLIEQQHSNKTIAHIYQALLSARQLDSTLQQQFSTLGISHLIAISGFHLGVLSALLFFLLKKPYQVFQNRYFPYRNFKRDSFIFIGFILFTYLLFLDLPASLLRAFGMLVVGFILYDRGIKVISMQTLFLTTLFLLALFPRLWFSIGFWLSIAGVFYIFLFLIHFKNLSKFWQFLLIPFWVYLMMLPYSLTIFANFSIYHPLSILWSTLFTLFYPLSIILHLFNYGDLLDWVLLAAINFQTDSIHLHLNAEWLFLYMIISLGSMYSKKLAYVTLFVSSTIFIHAIYNVT